MAETFERVVRGDHDPAPRSRDRRDLADGDRAPPERESERLDEADAELARPDPRQLLGQVTDGLLHPRLPVVHPARPRSPASCVAELSMPPWHRTIEGEGEPGRAPAHPASRRCTIRDELIRWPGT